MPRLLIIVPGYALDLPPRPLTVLFRANRRGDGPRVEFSIVISFPMGVIGLLIAGSREGTARTKGRGINAYRRAHFSLREQIERHKGHEFVGRI